MEPVRRRGNGVEQSNGEPRVGESEDEGEDLVVLLACGAYNPLHWGHLEILKLAKYGVEASGATVIGGFMSPAFDEYVKRKGDSTGESWAGAVDRLDMVQLATIDSNWLCPYAWEALQTVMHPASAVPVFHRLLSLLRQHYHNKAPRMRLVYVCGVDQLDPAKNGSELAACGYEVIAISRAGMQTIYAEQPNVRLIDDKEQLRYYSLSSTQFRAACSTEAGKDALENLVPPRVLKLLNERQLYGLPVAACATALASRLLETSFWGKFVMNVLHWKTKALRWSSRDNPRRASADNSFLRTANQSERNEVEVLVRSASDIL